MPPPADKPTLSPSILAALGLAACTGTYGPCLKVAPTGDSAETTTDTTDTTDTADTGTYGPCLDYAPPTGDTGATETGTDTGATDTGTTEAIFQRLEVEQVLPADVLERLKKRGS
jgi:hypothetical protein